MTTALFQHEGITTLVFVCFIPEVLQHEGMESDCVPAQRRGNGFVPAQMRGDVGVPAQRRGDDRVSFDFIPEGCQHEGMA